MDLAAYRPWTQNYWTDYVPKASQGLLTAPKPQRDYGLPYLPGEHRDAATWAAGAGGGGTGHIPAGAWRGSGKTYKTATGANAPWRFTSGDPQASNIYKNPWTARSMNLTPAQGKDWSGFLSDIDTSPVNKPGLLGVKFPKASKKSTTTA